MVPTYPTRHGPWLQTQNHVYPNIVQVNPSGCSALCSTYLYVVEAPLLGLPHDELPLCARVAHASDTALGVGRRHKQAHGAPAAAQLQIVLPIHQLGTLAVQSCGGATICKRKQYSEL